MAESNLDWKKVFKKILDPPKIDRSEKKEQKEKIVPGDSELSCSTENYEEQEPDVKYSTKITDDFPELSFASEQRFSKPVTSKCLEMKNNASNLKENPPGNVPEWNKVFKLILGDKSVQTDDEQKNVAEISFSREPEPVKIVKPESLCAKIDEPEPVIKAKPVPKKVAKKPFKSKNYRKKYKSDPKVDKEEREVREMFARSRVFEDKSRPKSINEYEGCGVNIFQSKEEAASGKTKSSNQRMVPDVPLTGMVAVKPMERGEMLKMPSVPSDEVWDDDDGDDNV